MRHTSSPHQSYEHDKLLLLPLTQEHRCERYLLLGPAIGIMLASAQRTALQSTSNVKNINSRMVALGLPNDARQRMLILYCPVMKTTSLLSHRANVDIPCSWGAGHDKSASQTRQLLRLVVKSSKVRQQVPGAIMC